MQYSIKTKRLSDQIIDAVRQMIKNEDFSPGDRFYSENELGTRLGVSRSSVREAVRMLEASGEVYVRQGKGIFISDPAANNASLFSGWLRKNRAAVLDNYEVRGILESKAAFYAAGRIDEDGIGLMESICVEYESALERNDRSLLIDSDERFHTLIARASGNGTLRKLMEVMTDAMNEGWISSNSIPARVSAAALEHRRILECIKSGDGAGAEAAMTEHLENATAQIRSFDENAE